MSKKPNKLPLPKNTTAALGIVKRIECKLAEAYCDCGCRVVGSVPEIRDHEPRVNAGNLAVAP